MPGTRPRAVILEGEAGIGKTTLWREALERPAGGGWQVLACAPAEAESAFEYTGLGDLIDPTAPLVADALDRVVEVQRSALLAALRSEAGPVDPVAVSRASLAVLADVTQRPTVIAIDDVQWLDDQSAQALAFAIRRLEDRPLAILLTRRGDGTQPLPLGLDRALPAEQVARRRLGPMSLAEIDELLRARLGASLSRPRLEAIQRMAGGNPLYAIEITRALAAAGDGADAGDADEPRLPPTLGQLVAGRLAALPEDVLDVVLLAALAARPTADLIAAAATGGEGALRKALADGVVVLDGPRLRLSHPLLASAAAELALPADRRSAHRRLAAATDDPIERALHRAQSAPGPDADLARDLEAAAEQAVGRGATTAAAELAGHAAALTPAGAVETRRRRLSMRADQLAAAGDAPGARSLLERLIEETPPGPERAGYLWRLGDAIGDDLDASIRLSEQALTEAGDDHAVRADIRTALGVFRWLAGDLRGATAEVRLVAEEAEAAGDERAVAIALGELCHAETVLGLPLRRDAMDRALAIEAAGATFPEFVRPGFQLAVCHAYTDHLDEARPIFEASLERVRGMGDEAARVGVLFRLAELELRAGRWERALSLAAESKVLARQAGIEQEQSVALGIDALVKAHVGQLDAARGEAHAAYEIAVKGGDAMVHVRISGTLGFIELSAGRPAEALAWLEPASSQLRSMGVGELCASQVVHNEIDALLALKRTADVEDRVAWLEEAARPTGRAWHAVVGQRGRALLAAERGDEDAALAAIASALAAAELLPQPFERGRTLLAAGSVQRRFKHWAVARASLERALEVFDWLGAARWSERTAADIGRLPGRPGRPAREDGHLSESERRVARLVAEGLTNKEIAGRLYVSTRTVETHLTRLYATLGLTSRVELAREAATWPEEDEAPS